MAAIKKLRRLPATNKPAGTWNAAAGGKQQSKLASLRRSSILKRLQSRLGFNATVDGTPHADATQTTRQGDYEALFWQDAGGPKLHVEFSTKLLTASRQAQVQALGNLVSDMRAVETGRAAQGDTTAAPGTLIVQVSSKADTTRVASLINATVNGYNNSGTTRRIVALPVDQFMASEGDIAIQYSLSTAFSDLVNDLEADSGYRNIDPAFREVANQLRNLSGIESAAKQTSSSIADQITGIESVEVAIVRAKQNSYFKGRTQQDAITSLSSELARKKASLTGARSHLRSTRQSNIPQVEPAALPDSPQQAAADARLSALPPVDLPTEKDFRKASARGLLKGGERSRIYEHTITALRDYHALSSRVGDDISRQATELARFQKPLDDALAVMHENAANLQKKEKHLKLQAQGIIEWLTKKQNAVRDGAAWQGDSLERIESTINAKVFAQIELFDEVQSLTRKFRDQNKKVSRIVKQTDNALQAQFAKRDDWVGELEQKAATLRSRVDVYLTQKQASSDLGKLDAFRALRQQVGDPQADRARFDNLVSTTLGVPLKLQMQRAMQPLDSATVSTVFKVVTRGEIGESGTNEGFAKLATQVSNDTTINIGVPALVNDATYRDVDPQKRANLIARQVISSRIASRLKLNVLASEVFSKTLNGDTLGITAKAPGVPMVERGVTDRYHEFNLFDADIQKGFADLQIIDAINGQMDRHLGNIFIDRATGQVTGIDNDMAHPIDRVFDDKAKNVLQNQFFVKDRTLYFKPDMIRRQTADAIIALSSDDLESILRGQPDDGEHLDDHAIRGTLLRFEAVQARCKELQEAGKLLDEEAWGVNTYWQAFQSGSDIGPMGNVGRDQSNYLYRSVTAYHEAGLDDNLGNEQIRG